MCIGILMLQLTFSPFSFIWSTPFGIMSLTRFHFVFQEPGQWRYMVLVMILLQCQFWCSDLCVALFLGDSAKLTIDSWLIDTYLGVSLPLCVVWTIEVSSFEQQLSNVVGLKCLSMSDQNIRQSINKISGIICLCSRVIHDMV